MNPKVSIIYVNWNTIPHINLSVETIELNKPKLTYEYIIVDNGSSDFDDFACPKNVGVKKFRFEKNMGYGVAANLGILISKGKYVCLLNPDTEPYQGWLDIMVEYLEKNPDVGLVGPSATNVCNPMQDPENNLGNSIESDMVIPFACVVIPKLIIQKMGLISLLYGEDIEYCSRIRKAGYKIVIVGLAFVKHNLWSSWFSNNIGEDQQAQIDYFRMIVAPRFLGEETE